jgi:5-methylcytosine-specific restriction endonuclease McrA
VVSNGVQRFCSRDCVYSTPAANPTKSKKSDVPDIVRKAVLKRDRNRCRFCRTNDGLHLHHVIYRSSGGLHVEHNLITLCNRHHSEVHSDKKRYQPLCLGVLWLSIVDRKHLTIPQFERFLDAKVKAGNEVY